MSGNRPFEVKGRAEAANAAVAEIFRALCIGVDTGRSLKAYLLLKYEEWEQLATFTIHPVEYCCPHAFSGDYAVTSFLRKNVDLPTTVDKRAVAIQAFKTSEQRCKLVNETFEEWTFGRFCFPSDVSEVLHLAQRKISSLIGVSPCEPSRYSWGPGATYDLRRTHAYPDTKLLKLPISVTGNALQSAASLINRDLHWKRAIEQANRDYSGPIFMIVPGGRYDTVPKTVLTDRSILVEPTLNTVLQKSIGTQLRVHLKRVRVDLDDQSWNQSLASLARDAGLATLDLEAASDSISRELVRFLLPPEWYDAMDSVRSRKYQSDGDWLELEKFSSMGNGFTFELESLIFWSLAAAVNDICGYTTIGIYGDDIIVRRECVPLLKKTLAAAGFSLNAKKSFVTGEFFESCGKHYFRGNDVTPAYQKESPVNDADRFRLANRLLRLACRLGSVSSPDERIEAAWRCALRVYEVREDFYGPYVGEGDGYVEVPLDWIRAKTRRGYFGTSFRIRRLVARPVEIPADDQAFLSLWFMTRGASEEMPLNRGTLRNEALRFRKELASESEPYTGLLPSRVSERVVAQHSWVDGNRLSTLLAW